MTHSADNDRHGQSPQDGAAYWLARLQGGNCAGEELRQFSAWRDSDQANADAYDRFRDYWDRLPSASTVPQILDLRLEALALQPAAARFQWRQIGSIAALFIFLLAGVLTLSLLTSRGPGESATEGGAVFADAGDQADQNIHLANSYSTGVGEQMKFRLADGSTVELNTNSRVEIDYSPDFRRLDLIRGEAVFHVAKNKARPFIVRSGQEQVTALGTVFMVRRDEDRTVVVLLEGRVKVDQLKNGAAKSPPVPITELTPGQQFASVNGKDFTVSRANVASATSWRTGRLAFDNDRLIDVVAEVNRYSDQKLVISDGSVGQLRISGTFRTGSAENFAKLLTQSFPVDVIPDNSSDNLLLKQRSPARTGQAKMPGA